MGDQPADAVAALYRLPPEQFVAARDDRVRSLRAAGESAPARQVAALRKPTVGAWLVNLLVADDPGLTEAVTELAGRLRASQEQLVGEDLRALGRQRQALVSGLVTRARALARQAGRQVTGAALDTEVESSLRAALADPDVARAVLSGRLTRAAEFAGFGPAPVRTPPGAPPRPATGRPSAAERRRAERQEQAQQRLRAAEAALAAAAHEQVTAETEAALAARRRADAQQRVASLQQEQDRAQRELAEAAGQDEQARWRRRRAAAARKAAQAALDRADRAASTRRTSGPPA